MLIQSIPFACILVLLLINVGIKRSWFCPSSLSLSYVALSFFGAILMVEHPRTGEPFVDSGAMEYLALNISLLCLPALAYRDGRYNALHDMRMSDPDVRLISTVLLYMTIPAALYYVVDAIPSLLSFVRSGIDRDVYRIGISEQGKSLIDTVVSLMAAFSFAALFMGVYVAVACPTLKRTAFLLLCGGFSNALGSLKMVSRATTYTMLVYFVAATMVLWPLASRRMRKFVTRCLCFIAVMILIPFAIITVSRFSSDQSDEGIFYSLISYFCTGPYSFNVDYVAHCEYDIPKMNGSLTNPVWLNVVDKVTGSHLTEDAEAAMEQLKDGMPEYRDISGAYSAEFKTVAGTFLMDYGPTCAMLSMSLVSFVLIFLFYRCRNSPLTTVCATAYFTLLMMAPIGYAFAQRHQFIMLVDLLAFGIYFQHCVRKVQ